MVRLDTSFGPVTLRLFADTPGHAENFRKLVAEGYYDGVLFHRVIKEFMIQTGDPDSKDAPAGKMLGSGGPDYKLDAEIVYPRHFHHRGALAAARQGDEVNPEKQSSGSQFYIVTGRKFTAGQLDTMERQLTLGRAQAIFNRLASEQHDSIMAMRRNRDREGLMKLQEELAAKAKAEAAASPFRFTPEQREAYVTVGGAPHLDGEYTVFGEVVDGMDVVDKIEQVATSRGDRPVDDVKIIKATLLDD